MKRAAQWIVCSWFVAATSARAHEGPPYPILVDQEAGPVRLSVWADPDVGTGTFVIDVKPGVHAVVPEDCRIELGVQPADGRLAETWHRAEAQRSRGKSRRFLAEVPFDRAEPWNLRFRIAGASGASEASARVDVTPPGQGPVLDFVLYLFPFVAVAFLFVKAASRRRSEGRAERGTT